MALMKRKAIALWVAPRLPYIRQRSCMRPARWGAIDQEVAPRRLERRHVRKTFFWRQVRAYVAAGDTSIERVAVF
jgi:hypothetical protein